MPGFENSFSKALRSEHPLETKRKENLKVTGIDFESDADGVYYSLRFEDGSVSNPRQTEIAPNDPVRAEKKKKELLTQYGLLEEGK